MSKVWNVEVAITVQMPVVANTKKEAEALALEFYQEAIDSGQDPDIDCTYAQEITKANVGDLAGSLPWGPDDDDEKRDWPISRWLAEKEAV